MSAWFATGEQPDGCRVLGLEVKPIYRTPGTEEVYPLVLRALRRSLSRALRRTMYEFTRTHTTQRPAHFHVLGKRAFVKSAWEVDGRLAAVADAFDFLLEVTPANPREAWNEFRRAGYEREPHLHYRPLRIDPAGVKRRLFEIPVERVEDPALALLFHQKQEEIDRQVTMLLDRNTPRFQLGSRALYGDVSRELVETALGLLERLPARSRERRGGKRFDAEAFRRRAKQELEWYAKRWKRFRSDVEVRADLGAGLMVSSGRLIVGAEASIPGSRVEALIQHEIGTHVVTYFNGRAQRFQLLHAGLAGYDALQEGLAVLAEHLVGGLSKPRLRLLAARVVAADLLVRGAGFLEIFRALVEQHGFERRTAFGITLRICRGGGLTKDALYLQGLIDVLAYFSRGGRLRPLLVGKLAVEHVPIIRELEWREIVRKPLLMPRYLELPHVAARLERVREGLTVFDLIERS